MPAPAADCSPATPDGGDGGGGDDGDFAGWPADCPAAAAAVADDGVGWRSYYYLPVSASTVFGNR